MQARVSNHLRMNLRKLFGIKPKQKKPYEFADVLHMWEDDHLMIELLPKDNLEFIKNESKRIDEFGKEHFDGYGFTDITEIGEIPIKPLTKRLTLIRLWKSLRKMEWKESRKLFVRMLDI